MCLYIFLLVLKNPDYYTHLDHLIETVFKTTPSIAIINQIFFKLFFVLMLFLSLKLHACMLSCLSCVWLFATLWTAAHQAFLSIGFSRQEYWNRLLSLPPGESFQLTYQPWFLLLLHCRQILYHWASREALKASYIL